MKPEDFITVNDFCTGHGISYDLVIELREYGLVEIVEWKNVQYIPMRQLPKTEKMLRLHSDLDINLEGVEVITQLLERIEDMQDEMRRLRNRLRLYE